MWKKHKNKNKYNWNVSYSMQIFWWILIISMSTLVGFRTLEMFSDENLTRVRENPSITSNITMFDYYIFWTSLYR
jgi:hypothetical protein